MAKIPRVAFVCVHNSCRSQMAEAISRLTASHIFEAYSAGTELKPQINQDAVQMIIKKYNYDMNEHQKPKLVESLPNIDIVITMGCNVNCPTIKCKHREDWGLNDPSGKGEIEFSKTIELIEAKVKNLIERIEKKERDI